jgi:hypothetical protein
MDWPSFGGKPLHNSNNQHHRCWLSKHQIIDSFGFSAVVRHRDCPALDALEALPDCAPRLGTCLPTALI